MKKSNNSATFIDYEDRQRCSMQFTRKGDYALKAMAYMAQVKGNTPHTIDEISENNNIPRHFLAKILKELTRANLLHSVKGARGGYTLAKRPSDISLLQVMEVASGPMALNVCIDGGGKCPESRSCVLYPVWQKASGSLLGIFGNTKLSSLRPKR